MITRPFPILVLALFVATGCKKKDAEPTAPGGGEKASAATPAPVDGQPSAEPAPGVESAPKTEPVEPEPVASSETKRVEPPKVEPKKVEPKKEVAHRLEPPRLPDPPEDNLLLVVRQAEIGCRADQPVCEARDLLAAKLVPELEAATELVANGTDAQKKTIAAALLRSRHPDTDALLARHVVAGNGHLDAAVVAHVAALRAEAAVEPLLAAMNQQNRTPEEVLMSFDALAAIGGEAAEKGLVAAFDSQTLAPWRGALCRALSRLEVEAAQEKIVAAAARLDATERQVRGCRGAEAAAVMLRSQGLLNLNIDGRQKPVTAVLVHHIEKDPLHLRVSFATDEGAGCDNPGTPETSLVVPLDREAEPLVGVGLASAMTHKGKALGADGSFLMRFDKLEMTIGAPAEGVVYHSHTRSGDPRVELSGRFSAIYCGIGG